MDWAVQRLKPAKGKRVFSSPKCPYCLWYAPILLFSGYQASFPRLKLAGCKVNHSPAFSAKVKDEWSCTSALPLCHHGMDRENFTFYFFIAIHIVVVDLKAMKPCANITFLTPVSRLHTFAFGWQDFSQSLGISCHCIIIVIVVFPYIIYDICCSISKGPIITLVLNDNS